MSVLGGHPLLSHVLICMALLSGVGVVSVKAPIRSLVASIAQTFLLAGFYYRDRGFWALAFC